MKNKFYDEVVSAMAEVGYVVEKSSVLKVNVEQVKLHITDPNHVGTGRLAVSVDFDYLFNQWERNGLEVVVAELKDMLSTPSFSDDGERQKLISSSMSIMDKDALAKNVFLQIINGELNSDLLQGVPHRCWNDLAIVYRYFVSAVDDSFGSILLTNRHLPEDIDENWLYERAYINTKEIFPAVIKPMSEIVGFAEPSTPHILVLSNQHGVVGASDILYPEVLESAAAKLGCEELVLLPSSLHEIIAVPYVKGDEHCLVRMVRNINKTQLKIEDFLSDNIYVFDVKSKKYQMFSEEESCATVA